MKAPAFWRNSPGLASLLLGPLAHLYGAVAAARLRRTGERLPCPVICIGNVTLGGAGKTPTAIAVASLLVELGRRPAFLTRGYGGSLRGPVLVDPSRHGPAEMGDEALILARHAPTVVARDRPAGARLCLENGADVVVMDDGMQNPSLVKDLTIAVFDGEARIGNGRVFPAGPLRAPLAAQMALVDATVTVTASQSIGGAHPSPLRGGPSRRQQIRPTAGPMTGFTPPGVGVGQDRASLVPSAPTPPDPRAQTRGSVPSHKREGSAREPPTFSAALVPDPDAAARLRGRRVLAFAGIGRPEKFFATLRACGAEVVETIAFADHHVFTPQETARLLARAGAADLIPVTTEKDSVRLGTVMDPARFATLPVSLRFERPDEVVDLLRRAVSPAPSAGGGRAG